MSGKGDDRRPSAISEQELAERWRSTFGNTERRRKSELELAAERAVEGADPRRYVFFEWLQ